MKSSHDYSVRVDLKSILEECGSLRAYAKKYNLSLSALAGLEGKTTMHPDSKSFHTFKMLNEKGLASFELN